MSLLGAVGLVVDEYERRSLLRAVRTGGTTRLGIAPIDLDREVFTFAPAQSDAPVS